MLTNTILIIISYFILWYVLSLGMKNASIIDIGWGFGFVVIAWIEFLYRITWVSSILVTLISIWGLRLTYHVFMRNFHKPEDFRYANFRKSWGKAFPIRSFFQLFMFQAAMMLLISFAFLYAIWLANTPNIPLLLIGIIVWIVGFALEAIADHQLKAFTKRLYNRGKLIQSGLWRYSRHPNYFGEALLWWGIFIIAISAGAPWFVIISPITITILVRFVSGVPFLEKRMMTREGYAEYKRRTSTFIPWFPKS